MVGGWGRCCEMCVYCIVCWFGSMTWMGLLSGLILVGGGAGIDNLGVTRIFSMLRLCLLLL